LNPLSNINFKKSPPPMAREEIKENLSEELKGENEAIEVLSAEVE
jgi:hypothetical protein